MRQANHRCKAIARYLQAGIRTIAVDVRARTAAMIGVVLAVPSGSVAAATSSGRCVWTAAGCSRTLTASVEAARDGDTITIAAGSYAGAVIDKSVKVVGAGARSTTLRGGGPVLTLGATGRTLTISVSGITVTGGVSGSSPQAGCGPDIPECGPGYARATALGGGIEVLPGAEVTIADSSVRGNRAAPTITVKSVGAACPDGPCPFAQAAGAGIDNWGTLTLLRTAVSDNEAGGDLTAQADGGGIVSELRSRLTLIGSTVTGNRALTGANGRFASGGGIYIDRFGTLTVQNSVVSRNLSRPTSSYPSSVNQMDANAGGIFVANGGTATIDGTAITGNRVVVDDPEGDPVGFDGGICVCGPSTSLTIERQQDPNNHVTATVGTSTAAKGGSGGAIEADGNATISGTRITGNVVAVESTAGIALAVAVVNLFVDRGPAGTLSDSVISGNSVTASSTTGSARIMGVGLANNGPAVLENVPDHREHRQGERAKRLDTTAAGIFNGLVFKRPIPMLTLRSTTVTGNTIAAGKGIPVEGGGLYTKGFPIRREHSVVGGNSPDQCAGC